MFLILLFFFLNMTFSSVQFSHSVVSDSATPWTAAHQASLSITNPWAYSNSCPSFWWCHSTISSPVIPISSSLKSFPESGSFPYWSFSFSISPSNEYSGLISFRIDWLDLLAVQEILKGLLQHYSSKASILWCLTFLILQHSHPYMTTGKTIALTRQIFVDKVIFLFFNMLSRLVIAFQVASIF